MHIIYNIIICNIILIHIKWLLHMQRGEGHNFELKSIKCASSSITTFHLPFHSICPHLSPAGTSLKSLSGYSNRTYLCALAPPSFIIQSSAQMPLLQWSLSWFPRRKQPLCLWTPWALSPNLFWSVYYCLPCVTMISACCSRFPHLMTSSLQPGVSFKFWLHPSLEPMIWIEQVLSKSINRWITNKLR